jgi:hypothetical protein
MSTTALKHGGRGNALDLSWMLPAVAVVLLAVIGVLVGGLSIPDPIGADRLAGSSFLMVP